MILGCHYFRNGFETGSWQLYPRFRELTRIKNVCQWACYPLVKYLLISDWLTLDLIQIFFGRDHYDKLDRLGIKKHAIKSKKLDQILDKTISISHDSDFFFCHIIIELAHDSVG